MILTLNGYVVEDDDQWLYDYFEIGAFCPGRIRRAIQDNPEGEELVLEINSPGGSVFAGFEIYTLLRGAPCRSQARVQSLAASAASTLMVGCTEARLSPVAQVMLHLPSSAVKGDETAFFRGLRMLDSITQSILNGYELKCGGKASRGQLEQLMRTESWLTAQQAVELGLADGLLLLDGETAPEGWSGVLPSDVVNAVGGGIRKMAAAMGPMPSPAVLLNRYDQLVAAGARPAANRPHGVGNTRDDWRRKARLAIEHNRYL